MLACFSAHRIMLMKSWIVWWVEPNEPNMPHLCNENNVFWLFKFQEDFTKYHDYGCYLGESHLDHLDLAKQLHL